MIVFLMWLHILVIRIILLMIMIVIILKSDSLEKLAWNKAKEYQRTTRDGISLYCEKYLVINEF